MSSTSSGGSSFTLQEVGCLSECLLVMSRAGEDHMAGILALASMVQVITSIWHNDFGEVNAFIAKVINNSAKYYNEKSISDETILQIRGRQLSSIDPPKKKLFIELLGLVAKSSGKITQQQMEYYSVFKKNILPLSGLGDLFNPNKGFKPSALG